MLGMPVHLKLILLFLPKKNALVISDDGHGMTDNQFKERWMKLGYNRIKHQGNDVEFPAERSGGKRKVYGRNGVGRHGLICFSDNYEVKTKSKGIESIYKVGTRNLKNPFYIESSVFNNLAGNGTSVFYLT
jgi:HSP90 family molecular chaperone